jgi:hypothetical protein
MKIVQVLNAMISNPDKITGVIRNGKEFFFLYKEKYKWSINQLEDGNYAIHLYPDSEDTIEGLANLQMDEWMHYNYVTYSTKEIKTQEAEETFSELYKIVGDKLYGLDDIFNDILADF